MSDLYLHDDAAARLFEPFALTRPAGELRAGALLLRERWERALGLRCAGAVGADHLDDFEEPGAPKMVRQGDRIPRGSVLAASRCAVALGSAAAGDVWRCGGRVAAVLLDRDVDASELRDGGTSLEDLARSHGRSVEIAGRWMDHVWDFIGYLPDMLGEDVTVLGEDVPVHAGAMVSGPHKVFAEAGATIEPQVYFDTSAGPVLIRRGATVQAFTRIVGPCAIGEESQVGSDKIATCSVGNVCKVHGEMSTTILLGHANKGHDGFVGHSYLGRWVNLGAGTITSNLKNTYGSVQLWTPEGERDTGLQFLGTLFGDHVKTGIGTSLSTGTVIGAGANIYGGVMPPKAVAPFAWGDKEPYGAYRIAKFLEVAGKAMQRRHVELSSSQRRHLTSAFERRWKA